MDDRDLGVFRFQGFTLKQGKTLRLYHAGELIEEYEQPPDIDGLHLDCKLHLVNAHGADKRILLKPSVDI